MTSLKNPRQQTCGRRFYRGGGGISSPALGVECQRQTQTKKTPRWAFRLLEQGKDCPLHEKRSRMGLSKKGDVRSEGRITKTQEPLQMDPALEVSIQTPKKKLGNCIAISGRPREVGGRHGRLKYNLQQIAASESSVRWLQKGSND